MAFSEKNDLGGSSKSKKKLSVTKLFRNSDFSNIKDKHYENSLNFSSEFKAKH